MSEARYEEEADDDLDFNTGGSSDYVSAEARSYQRSRALRRFIKYCILFLIFASAVGFAIYAWGVKDRMQADMQAFDDRGADFAKDFLADLQAEHYDAAYQSLSAEYKQRSSAKQFEEYVQKRREVLKDAFTTHKFKSMQGSLAAFGKKVTAEYHPTRKTTAGKTEGVVVTILREHGELKVDNLTFEP